MTVQELMNVSPWCECLEVIIRMDGHGKWLYGFRIAKNATIYPSEGGAEVRELRELKEYTPYPNSKVVVLKDGDVVNVSPANDLRGDNLNMKVISRDPKRKLPEEIGSLEVSHITPRRLGKWNDLGHNYEVWCFPPEDMEELNRITREKKTRQQAIEEDQQICIEDWMGGNE